MASIPCSARDAANECRLNKDTAARAFKELIELGFIEETLHGSLSRKTRIASEWRLSAFRCDLTGEAARLSQTRDSQAPSPVLNDARSKTAACPKRGTVKNTSLPQKKDSACPERGPVPVPNEGTLNNRLITTSISAGTDGLIDLEGHSRGANERRWRQGRSRVHRHRPHRAASPRGLLPSRRHSACGQTEARPGAQVASLKSWVPLGSRS